ncbi:MAG: histidine phosphatase family protein [Clostridia bacterium]|nr:histidine phosphatase family protein [Clostridia bacterium]
MTTLILVRHGQSNTNLEQRFTGQGHAVLTELGQKQAECTAHYLDRYSIDVIYSSDLTRSMQTAEATARRQGRSVIPNANLREIDAGLWEGLPYAELKKTYPESYALWTDDLGRAHPDGGESVTDLAERMCREVDALAKQNPGKCIAIFSHATPVRMAGCRWMGVPFEEAASTPRCSNASVTIAEYDDEGHFLRLVEYAYDRHLGEHTTFLPAGLA